MMFVSDRRVRVHTDQGATHERGRGARGGGRGERGTRVACSIPRARTAAHATGLTVPWRQAH